MYHVIPPIFRVQTSLLPIIPLQRVEAKPFHIDHVRERLAQRHSSTLTDTANNVAGLMFLNWLHTVLTCCFMSCKCIEAFLKKKKKKVLSGDDMVGIRISGRDAELKFVLQGKENTHASVAAHANTLI